MPGFDAHLSRKPIKNINVRINRDGKVNISAPIKCSLEYIKQFLQKKHGWVITNQTRLLNNPHPVIQDLQPDVMYLQRQQMQSLLPEIIQKWEAIIGVQVNQWYVRAMKTRWGTCNTKKKRICLNLHLIQKPLICLEYVVVHELVHLLEASHNQRFYALMSQFMPEWKEYKILLTGSNKHENLD